MKTFAENILDFLFHLKLPFKLPNKIEVLDLQHAAEVQAACKAFYNKFYNDHNKRYLLIGINPGRFGGGVTGIPFTDPVRLQNDCGIANDFQKNQELSSAFIYDMINAYGGAAKFYNQFYISAVSPLGFVREGKNLNYYDDKILQKRIEPFVIDCMEKQLAFGLQRDICFCIGEGENLKFLKALNEKYQWFETIKQLSHPRFVMQYKLKSKDLYIIQYLDALHQLT
ncbi:SMUG2 DNA glycosylase family protein [soil metagenome]